jgi:hypothetical protein
MTVYTYMKVTLTAPMHPARENVNFTATELLLLAKKKK